MNSEQSIHLQYLMLRFFEGSISEEEFQKLNQTLKESEAAQTLYFSYLKVYLAIKNARYIDTSAESDLDLGDFLDELGRYENLAPTVIEEAPVEEPVYLKKKDVKKVPYRFNKSSVYAALTALAATIVIIATIYFMPPRVTPYPVARVLNATRAEWSQDESSKSRSILFEGGLEVARGTLKFAMYDGTEVTLKGPAVVELEEISRLFLHRGSMRANVPPVATGFTVCTPCGSIVDFGTEFTVDVDVSGETHVEVLKGVVELRDSSNPLIFKHAQKLTEGQEGDIDAKGRITWSQPKFYANGEIRVQWGCENETGRWANRSFWADGLIRNPELVAEFRAVDSPKTVLIDAETVGQDKIMGRRADVGLLSRYPVTVRMDGGQAQFEQLWVGRMGESQAAEGRWIMSDGELILKGRDQVMLLVGDKCKGFMEVDGGRVEVYGSARIGCNEWYSVGGEADSLASSEGVLMVHQGKVTIYGILEVASNDGVGTVQLSGGQIQAFDLRVGEKGRLVMTGGVLVLEGNKTAGVQVLIDAGLLQSSDREISIEYDEQDVNGFGRDKTIIRLKP